MKPRQIGRVYNPSHYREFQYPTVMGVLCKNERAFSIYDIRIDNPIEDKIITEIAPNTSSLTNAEEKYTPRNPIMRANAAISCLIFKLWLTFF